MSLSPAPPARKGPGRFFFGLAVLLLVITGAVYLVATFSSTSMMANAGSPDPTYNWTGGQTLLLESAGLESTHCDIKPASGDARTIMLARQNNSESHRDSVLLQPWFTGDATVTCHNDVHVWAGGMAVLRQLVASRGYLYGAIALITVLVLLAGMTRRRTG